MEGTVGSCPAPAARLTSRRRRLSGPVPERPGGPTDKPPEAPAQRRAEAVDASRLTPSRRRRARAVPQRFRVLLRLKLKIRLHFR
jgi:hypothetical protein